MKERLTTLYRERVLANPEVALIREPWRWRALGACCVAALAASVYAPAFGSSATDWRQAFGGSADTAVTLSVFLRQLIQLTFMILGGSLGDLYGRRRILSFGLAGLGGVSLLGLFVARTGIQWASITLGALFSAVSLPLSLAVIFTVLTKKTRSIGVAGYSTAHVLGVTLGPLLAGLMGKLFGPHYAFVLPVLLAAVGLYLVTTHVPDSADEGTERQLDAIGIALFALGMTGLAIGAGMANSVAAESVGLTVNAGVILGVGLGILSLAAFFVWETRLPEPVLDMALFRRGWFAGALLAGIILAFGREVALKLLTIFFLLILRIDLAQVLTVLLPMAIAALVAAVLVPFLYARVNAGVLLALGVGLMGLGMFRAARLVSPTAIPDSFRLPLAVLGAGLVLVTMIRTLVLMGAVPQTSYGAAAALLSGTSQLGSVVGSTMLVTLTAAFTRNAYEQLPGASSASMEQVRQSMAALQAALHTTTAAAVPDVSLVSASQMAAGFEQAFTTGLAQVLLLTSMVLLAATVLIFLGWRRKELSEGEPADPMPSAA